jgi:hypothetical protein
MIMIACWVVLFLFWMYLWPILSGAGRRAQPRSDNPRPLADQLFPHLFWISVLIIFFGLLVFLARRQFGRQVSRMWQEIPHLRQLRTVRFDDDGVTTDHALLHSLTRWPMFQRLDETPRLFLLCASDYDAEIYPKRAFPGSSADEFRRMAQAKMGERIRAFEVLPVVPLPPERP